MFESSAREQLRRAYAEAWAKRRAGRPLTPLEAQIAEVVGEHPEYHALLESLQAGSREFDIGQGEANPFLHLGMHLALREQVATDRPAGIAVIHRRLCLQLGQRATAEHAMMDCLGSALWEAQRHARPPDEAAYLDCLRRLQATVRG